MKLAFAFKVAKGGKVEVITPALPFLEARDKAIQAAPKTQEGPPVYLVKLNAAKQVKPWVGMKRQADVEALEKAVKSAEAKAAK